MIFGHLALVAAAVFTGVALFINVVAAPAWRALDDDAAWTQWMAAHGRVAALQFTLMGVGAVCGGIAFTLQGNWRWLAGGLLMLAAWPFSFIAIAPVERKLRALGVGETGPESRRLLSNWSHLHLIRTGLGALATLVFFWAAGQ